MLKVRLPIKFEDGKQMYDAVLAIINKKSPVLATMIHDNIFYNPFSLELPDIVNVLGLEIEPIFKGLDNVEILKETSHLELLNATYTHTAYTLYFKNTTFRNHRCEVPLPMPDKILLSLKDRWNQLYHEKISIEIPFPGERSENFTFVRFADTRTSNHKIGDYKPFICFSGKVILKAYGSDEYLHQFNVLMRFSEFAGVGHKRPMGMGVVKLGEAYEK